MVENSTGEADVAKSASRFFDAALESGAFVDFDPDEEAAARRILELAEIGRGERLFEPGCGAGRFTQMLAERVGPTGRVDACEMAPRMIEAAMGRVREDWAHIHRVSALEVALPLGGVDAILCFNLWPHLTRLDEHLARFASLLRPSGRLVVAHSLCRESVNAIHGMVAPKALCVRELPPAEQLAADLEALGWRPRKAVDEEVYFVSCGPPEEPKD